MTDPVIKDLNQHLRGQDRIDAIESHVDQLIADGELGCDCGGTPSKIEIEYEKERVNWQCECGEWHGRDLREEGI